MSKSNPTNLAASVRHRLHNISRQRQEDFNLLMVHYAIERLLFRLSQSSSVEQFILKGATLFAVWNGSFHRPTQDIDLLGYGENSSEILQQRFADICAISVEPDGLLFDPQVCALKKFVARKNMAANALFCTPTWILF